LGSRFDGLISQCSNLASALQILAAAPLPRVEGRLQPPLLDGRVAVLFADLEQAPMAPVLGMAALFAADNSADNVDLGIGI
jgi:hypothetical protein